MRTCAGRLQAALLSGVMIVLSAPSIADGYPTWPLFLSMASMSPTEVSAVSAYCKGNPKTADELDCKLVQQSFWGGMSAERIAKETANIESIFAQPAQAKQLLKETCALLKHPLTPAQQQAIDRKLAFPAMRETADDLKRACEPTPSLARLKQTMLKGAQRQANVCYVPPSREWTTRFFKDGERSFRSTPSDVNAEYNCGAVTVERLEVDEAGAWTYRTQRAYLDRDTPKCRDAPATLELVYSDASPGEFPLSCSAVKFGIR